MSQLDHLFKVGEGLGKPAKTHPRLASLCDGRRESTPANQKVAGVARQEAKHLDATARPFEGGLAITLQMNNYLHPVVCFPERGGDLEVFRMVGRELLQDGDGSLDRRLSLRE